jgi:hypothetical protein
MTADDALFVAKTDPDGFTIIGQRGWTTGP